MEFENKKLRDVADVAARIMMGEKALHPNQQKLDVHEPEKDELTAKDFEMLRNKKKMKEAAHEESCECDDCSDKKKEMVKEGAEMLEEGFMDKVKGVLGQKPKSTNLFDQPHVKKDTADYLKKSAKQPQGPNNVTNIMAKEDVAKNLKQAVADKDKVLSDINKKQGLKLPTHSTVYSSDASGKITQTTRKIGEETEELDEMFPGTPEYEKKYGKVPQDMKKGEKKKTTQGEMEKTEKGVVHKRKFSEMVESYNEGGVKGLFKKLNEEPTNAEFTAQLDDAKKRADGTKKQPEVAKGTVQAVQNEETHTTVEVIDLTDPDNITKSEIDLSERELTAAETKKKEEIVKSMKKGLAGFKERYGERAKEVMYATATANAKKSS